MAYMTSDDWYVVKDASGIVIQNARDDDDDWGGWVRIPQEDFDALVLMRYAQMVEEPVTLVSRAVEICEKYQNLGTEALRRWCGLPPLFDPNGPET